MTSSKRKKAARKQKKQAAGKKEKQQKDTVMKEVTITMKPTKDPGSPIQTISLNQIPQNFWKHPGFRELAEESENPPVTEDIKAQFVDPTLEGDKKGFVVLHTAALPDEKTPGSLASRGPWCVIMVAGINFCVAIWDKEGTMLKSKSVVIETSAKQGKKGKQAKNADKNSLQAKVNETLASMSAEMGKVKTIYLQATDKEKETLLFGKNGPLTKHEKKSRDIPFPRKKKVTLNHAYKVYELLTTVTFSDDPLLPEGDGPAPEPMEIDTVTLPPSRKKVTRAITAKVVKKKRTAKDAGVGGSTKKRRKA